MTATPTVHLDLVTLTPRPGRLQHALARLEKVVTGPALLGCWTTMLGHAPRIFVLRRAGTHADHDAMRGDVVGNRGVLSLADVVQAIECDTWATLPCLPDVVPGAYGGIYEFRIYALQPMGALQAAITGWADVIQTRLDIAPITAVMHSVSGVVPRLVHIYPYRDMAHRLQVREQAVATGRWPPRGGASRNLVMAAEMAVPAPFSPLH